MKNSLKEFTEEDPEYTNEFVSKESSTKLAPKNDNVRVSKNGGLRNDESKVSIKVEMPG